MRENTKPKGSTNTETVRKGSGKKSDGAGKKACVRYREECLLRQRKRERERRGRDCWPFCERSRINGRTHVDTKACELSVYLMFK